MLNVKKIAKRHSVLVADLIFSSTNILEVFVARFKHIKLLLLNHLLSLLNVSGISTRQ